MINEIIKLAHQIEEMIDGNDGEVTEDILELIQINDSELESELDRLKEVMDYLKAQERYLKEKADEFTRKAKSRSNAADRLKNYVSESLQLLGMDKIKTASYSFYHLNSESVEVDETGLAEDEKETLAELGLFKRKYSPVKKALKSYFTELPVWMKIVNKKSLVIR